MPIFSNARHTTGRSLTPIAAEGFVGEDGKPIRCSIGACPAKFKVAPGNSSGAGMFGQASLDQGPVQK